MKLNETKSDDILKKISDYAAVFTPEWNFNNENPDVGFVLSRIFSDMHYENIKKRDRIFDKQHINFINFIGGDIAPPKPAEGYLTVTADNEIFIDKETIFTVIINTDNAESTVKYTPVESVFITNAAIEKKFSVCDNCIYEDLYGKNLQKYEFTLSLGNVGICQLVKAEFGFYGCEKYPEFLTDKNICTWSYYGGEEFISVDMSYDGHFFLLPIKEKSIETDTELILKCQIHNISQLKKLQFNGGTFSLSAKRIKPDITFSNDVENLENSIFPFGKMPNVYNEFYIMNNEAFSKIGSEITLSFDISFEKIPSEFTYTLPVMKQHKCIFGKYQPPEIKSYESKILEVRWEYFNGLGWKSLFDENKYSDIFDSSLYSFNNTENKKNIKIKFICPDDIVTVKINSAEGYFIRAGVLQADNLYKPNLIYISPIISDIRISYNYDSDMRNFESLTVYNNLETATYKDFNSVKLFENLFLDSNFLYFGFNAPFNGFPLSIFFEIAENSYINTFKWEYYSDIGWEALNCIDNTKNLTKSGQFIINSAVNICRKHLLGNDMFWLRAEKCNQNSDKFDIPIISNIYINTFKVINSNSKNSTDQYADGYNVGKSGNIPKNSEINVDKSFGTAVQAFNHFAMFGGNDCENTEEAVKRISAQLKHKDRCVVVEDYNLLIKNFEKNICKTKIINAGNNITIFILIEEFTPEYFESIKNSLITFLKEKMPLGIKLNVLPPIFTEYHIQADIISDYNFSDFDIKENILNAIKEFINPVYGNFDGKGWNIGILPNENQIISIVKNVKNVIAFKEFHIKFYQNNEEINYQDISDNSVAVFSDKCSIKILHTNSQLKTL